MDNLRKWCCLCKSNGESPDHLLLHCSFAQELWTFVFCLFGISWVMPLRVLDLLSSWRGNLGKSSSAVVWGAVPHCVMWVLCVSVIIVYLRAVRLHPWRLNQDFLGLCLSGCLTSTVLVSPHLRSF